MISRQVGQVTRPFASTIHFESHDAGFVSTGPDEHFQLYSTHKRIASTRDSCRSQVPEELDFRI
jgi:hypothetical protein